MQDVIEKFKALTSRFVNRIKVDSLALWFALRHPETPVIVTVLLWFVVAYALSPIDLIPDFIPVIGLLDDLVILAIAIFFAVRLLPVRVIDRCRALALQFVERNKKQPTIFIGAFLVIFLWLLIAYGFYFLFFETGYL